MLTIAGVISDVTPLSADRPRSPSSPLEVPVLAVVPLAESPEFRSSGISRPPPLPTLQRSTRPSDLELSLSPAFRGGASSILSDRLSCGQPLSTGLSGSSLSSRRLKVRTPTLAPIADFSPTGAADQRIRESLPGLQKTPSYTVLVCEEVELGKGGNSRVLKGHYTEPHPYAHYEHLALKMTSMTEAKLPQFAMLRRVYTQLQLCRGILKPIVLYYTPLGQGGILGTFIEVLPLCTTYTLPVAFIPCRAHLQRIVKAVKTMHELGVAHLDLKSGNILADRWGLPYLSDFGESKLYLEEGVKDLPVGTTTSLIANARSMPLFFDEYDACVPGDSESLRARLPLVISSFTMPAFLPYIDLLMLGIMFDEVFVEHAEKSVFPRFAVSRIRSIGRQLIYSALRQLLTHWQSNSGILEGVRLNPTSLPGFRAHRPVSDYTLADCMADLRSL